MGCGPSIRRRRQEGIGIRGIPHILESVLGIIKASLASGDDVLISGFGKFTFRQKVARRGRNPATGEDLPLGPRRVIAFKCSPELRERIMQG